MTTAINKSFLGIPATRGNLDVTDTFGFNSTKPSVGYFCTYDGEAKIKVAAGNTGEVIGIVGVSEAGLKTACVATLFGQDIPVRVGTSAPTDVGQAVFCDANGLASSANTDKPTKFVVSAVGKSAYDESGSEVAAADVIYVSSI